MNFNKAVVVSVVALVVACAAVLTALNERVSRSPSALIQANGKLQMLYPYGWSGYPYDGYGPYPSPYDPYGYGYGYDGYADYYDGYQQYASAVQQQQYSDYLQQRQYADWAQQQAYYNWAAANSAYKSKNPKNGEILRVADGSNGQKLVYMGDFEFNGYKKEITGGNDGGFNAPFDINGDGQEIGGFVLVQKLIDIDVFYLTEMFWQTIGPRSPPNGSTAAGLRSWRRSASAMAPARLTCSSWRSRTPRGPRASREQQYPARPLLCPPSEARTDLSSTTVLLPCF